MVKIIIYNFFSKVTILNFRNIHTNRFQKNIAPSMIKVKGFKFQFIYVKLTVNI